MKLKTILLQGTALFFCAALLISCETSKKGKWTDADKKKARIELEKEFSKMNNEDAAVFSTKELRDKFINCAIAKAEQTYSSFEDADSDETGMYQIGYNCGLALAAELMPSEEYEPSEELEEIDQ
jgi:hypothetical protein